MTTDDLLFSNNSNVFVVDKETVQLSEERGRFHLRCHFRRSVRDGDAIVERWDEAVVAFEGLTQDVERQRVYYFDCEAGLHRLHEEDDQSLRDEFSAFWMEVMDPHFNRTPENLAAWADLKRRMAARDVTIPEHPSGDAGFRSLMHGVLSAISGKPVGWQFDSLIQVAHQLAQAHPENLLAFGYAVEHAGNKMLLECQDTSGKWARRRREFRPRILARDPAYIPQAKWLPALTFMFPEVGASVRGFVERNLAAEQRALLDGGAQ